MAGAPGHQLHYLPQHHPGVAAAAAVAAAFGSAHQPPPQTQEFVTQAPAGVAPSPQQAFVPNNLIMATSALVAGGSQQSSLLRRVVKWVISGDYLVLRDHPRGGPPPEYYVNLAYVAAPRFNRTPGEDSKTSVSEPFAWEAKEYLAKRLIGQEVIYKSEYTRSGGPASGPGGAFGSNSNKEFGLLYVGDENIVETMVSEGLLEVRRSKAESTVLQTLIEAEENAKKDKKGKWGPPPPKRELIHEHPNPPSLKGKTFTGTVENVRNGGAIQVYLDLGEEQGIKKYLNASIMVSGIRSPDKNKANESKFFDESKYFTEARLLNREVKVHIEKVDRNSFLATIFLGQNNLAEALLRQGMARCNDASISLTKAPEKLRAAEKEAKSKRLRIWENYVDSRGDGPTEAFEAKVTEVISGDSMIVENLIANEPQKKIFLASIRLGIPADRDKQQSDKQAKEKSEANKSSTAQFDWSIPDSTTAAAKPAKDPKSGGNKSAVAVSSEIQPNQTTTKSSVPRIYDNAILYNARELLRKKLLGKKVLVKVEYIQPKSNAYPEKVCCTVRLADQPKWNAAEALVSKGYASVIKHFSDDSQRASNFDELLKVEQLAVKNKELKEKNGPLKITDICNDATRAKQLMPFLSRTRKDAVVEFVYSASKFKLLLAKENNTLLNLVLAGVNVPRETEALKNSSTALVKSLVHQRDVTISIDNMDKKGNFIGSIYYKNEADNKETSLSLQLVKLGYAQVREISSAPNVNELKAAEAIAREKKLGLWLTYQEPKKHEPEEHVDDHNDENDASAVEEGAATALNGVQPTAKAPKEEDVLKNRKLVIVSNAQFKEKNVIVSVQLVEAGPKLKELLKQMRTELPSGKAIKANSESFTPSKDMIVAAKFSADKQWYRARVVKYNSPTDIDIVFIDYGNEEKVKQTEIVQLPNKYTSQAPFASDYALAFVEAPIHDQDWIDECRNALLEAISGQVHMKVEYKHLLTGLDAISLVNDTTKTDIGKKLVENGLLVASKKKERKLIRVFNEYSNAEKLAKQNRANMWQYGDFTADEAREFGRI